MDKRHKVKTGTLKLLENKSKGFARYRQRKVISSVKFQEPCIREHRKSVRAREDGGH